MAIQTATGLSSGYTKNPTFLPPCSVSVHEVHLLIVQRSAPAPTYTRTTQDMQDWLIYSMYAVGSKIFRLDIQNGKRCEAYIVPSMMRLMYQLKSVLK